MDTIYIFGHRNPDTDSVTAAISLSYLKNQLGFKTKPMVLGNINPETRYVLDYFQVKEPKYLNNVSLQIKDVNYHKGYYLNENTSILSAYHYMSEKGITGIPLVDDHKKLQGLVTLKMLVKQLVEGNFTHLDASYDGIMETIQGEEITRFDDTITGDIVVASFRSTTFLNNISLTKNSILIVGDRHSIIEYAVNSGVKMVIVVGNGEIHENHIEIARKNHVNMIRTSLDSFHAAKLIGFSNYVKKAACEKDPICFDETETFDQFIEISKKLRHNNYPVVDKSNNCLGLIRVTDITEKNKKKVILVDHNELEQSVEGLKEAEILEIVDHHKIGDLTTSAPINFRNMAVGSTNTIIYFLYQENHIEIPKEMAGMMISGILSDTLALTAPTTTQLDKSVVYELAKIAEVDVQNYAMDMLKAGSSFEGKTKEEILQNDLKVFPIADTKVAVSQVLTFDIASFLQEKESYLQAMEEMRTRNGYDSMIMVITDILAQASYLFYTEEMAPVLQEGFHLDDIYEGVFVAGCVSRKKQVIPAIVTVMEEK